MAKEKLENLEEDQLVEQAVRELKQALAANCLTKVEGLSQGRVPQGC